MAGPNLPLLAWRNLWRNRRRTLLTLLSLTFGLFLAVLFTAMQDRSFADMVDVAARMGGGHVTIQHPEYLDYPSLSRTVSGSDALIQEAEATPHAYKAVARISGQAMVATAGQNYGALVMGYDPAAEDDQTLSFLEGVPEGQLLQPGDELGTVLGTRLARNLGVELGDKVVYTMMDRHGEIVGGLARVRGLLATGSPGVDAALMLLPIDSLRKTLGYDADESTQIAVFLSDSRKSDPTVEALIPKVDDSLASVHPWYEVNAELAGFIGMKVGGARFFELVILVLIAASVFNTLFVSVMERLREFGIMMAIGYSPGQIFRLVMWESLLLGVLGVLAGMAFTWPLYSYLAENGIDLSAQMGDQAMDVAGVGFSPILHVGIFPENFAVIVVVLLLSTLAAGLYPAWWAGRVEPVESIKLV